MLSFLESVRTSFRQDNNSVAGRGKRSASREESVSDDIQSPPSKRRRDYLKTEEESIVASFISRAMSWADKYTFWKKQTKDFQARSRVQQHTDQDEVICTRVVVRGTQDDVICLDDVKPSKVKSSTNIKPRSNRDSSRSVNQSRKFPDRSFESSTPARPDCYITKCQPPIFKMPSPPDYPSSRVFKAQQHTKSKPSGLPYEMARDGTSMGRSQTMSHATSTFNTSIPYGSFSIGSDRSRNTQGMVHVGPSKPQMRRKVSSNRYRTTADEVVRLKEKEVYMKLLSQFTDRACAPQLSHSETEKENASADHSRNAYLFETAETTVGPTGHSPYRASEWSCSILQARPQSPLGQNLSQGSAPLTVKIKASPISTREHSHIQDVPLFSRIVPMSSPSSSSSFSHTRAPASTLTDDPLLSNWTKKWRDILSPENQEREREKARIALEENKLKRLREKRREEEQRAVQEIHERIRREEESEEEEEEEEEEELVPLSDDMEQKINAALAPGNPGDNLTEGFNLTITRGDLATLSNLNWLNDEVINFYFNMIAARSKEDPVFPKVHFFNSFFYPKLIKTGHASLKRWTRKVDIFTVDLILVPIHLGMHWCLAAIDFRKKTVLYYDSLKGTNIQCLDALQKYLKDESLDKKKVPFDTTGWTAACPKDIPEQLNGCDCGVFTCTYAEYLSRDAKFTFNQLRMPYIRRKMVYEILSKKLL